MVIPIRLKIALLITASLVASLSSYLYFGTRLLVDDKASYIYDHNLNLLRGISSAIEDRVELATRSVRIMASSDSYESRASIYRAEVQELGVEGILILSPARARFGPGAERLAALLPKLGWNDRSFAENRQLVGVAGSGALAIGAASETGHAGNAPSRFALLFRLERRLFERLSEGTRVHLTDSDGNTVFSNVAEGGVRQDLSALGRTLAASEFDSGMQELSFRGHSYIVGYQKLLGGSLVLKSLISKQEAFGAARELSRRSLVLGISILLFAIGMSLLLARSLTRKIQQLWKMTQRVSSGDFSVRMRLKGRSRDELDGLARAFDTMAVKIQALIRETAEKSRMESELKTAKTVQETLFPAPRFRAGKLELAAFYEPASECGGDWWHCCEIDDRVLLWIGDATGHGAPAALITSAARSAASILEQQRITSPSRILGLLNKAIFETSKGRMAMTFCLLVIDKRTGAMRYCSAGHPMPFVVRKGTKALAGSANPPLGHDPDGVFEEAVFQLQEGDVLALFTDGLTEARGSDGAQYGRKKLLKDTQALLTSHSALEAAVQKTRENLLGLRAGATLEDDVTFLLCRFGSEPPA
ncbi:MAG: SpoIIE family protein phosphatase [Oligoflexia bacterium]|nr:SpoIIE family protein phosphatase [Oligoflexia bacterium]